MKKTLILAVALAIIVTAGNANDNAMHNSRATRHGNADVNMFINPFANTKALVNDYIWYTDEELTNPTGSYCSVSEECARLRNLYPGYVFSAYHYMGLHKFEWGVCPPLMNAIIYSDMTYL